MKIADLFVGIDIDGGAKSVRTLDGIQKGVGNVASTSLEAKAAIVGMVYALQRLSTASNQEGTALKQFATLTGLSTDKLQKWQYAARQVGASNDEMTSSIKGVQQKMFDLVSGKGAPDGMDWFASSVDLSGVDLSDTFAVMDKLQEFAVQFRDQPELIRQALGSFGVSDGVMAGMFQGSFNDDIFAQAPKYNKSQIKALDQMRAQWGNLFDDIERGVAKVNLDHMTDFLPEIRSLVKEVLKMVDAFSTLAKKLELIKGISMIFEGWGLIFDGVTKGVNAISAPSSNNEGFLQNLLPANWNTSNKPTTNNVEVTQTFQNNGDNAGDVRRGALEGIAEAFKNIGQEAN